MKFFDRSELNEWISGQRRADQETLGNVTWRGFVCDVSLDVERVFDAMWTLFGGWIFREKDEDKKKYVRKLRVVAPHWRLADRAFLLRALETNGKSCPGSYAQRLLKEVGPERFKRIAFGDEKFCNGCGRSSYVGEDRLWACEICVHDHRIRPKARYCNGECQRLDWLKHKATFHSGKKQATNTKKIQVVALG